MSKITISLSSSHAKRMARLREAEQEQSKGFKIADVIHIIATPEFDRYYRNEFQAYLQSREDVLTTGDQDASDDSYLDVVMFLNGLLEYQCRNERVPMTKVNERKPVEMQGTPNGSLGDRKGITLQAVGVHRNPARNSVKPNTVKT